MELESERVIVQAPMSYTGSAKRIWRLGSGGWRTLLIFVIAAAWVVVTGWYLLWGIWLIPYRVIRRGERKRKRQALQHREMLEAASGLRPPVGYAQPTTPPTAGWTEMPRWSK